jgi:mannose-1-phosphate guanylyltransferase
MSGAGTGSHGLNSEPPILTSTSLDPEYSAVILAGGEGIRLSTFTRKIYGYHVPKQFCPLFGGKTLLEETMRRVSLLVPPSRTITVLNRAHKRFYSPLLNSTEHRNLLLQPENRGTAPAILCSLLRLVETGHSGPVAIFPSDHYVSDNFAFMGQVATAIRVVERVPRLTVLLGIAPDGPESDYGWIEPGAPIEVPLREAGQVRRIGRFVEKPTADVARELYDRHYLWNSFVLIGNATTLLSLIAGAEPELYRAFEGVRPFFGGAVEAELLRMVFRELPSADFSSRVLARVAEELSVLPVEGVRWSDLGDPRRLGAVISNSDNHTLGGNQLVPGIHHSFPPVSSPEQTRSDKALQAQR